MRGNKTDIHMSDDDQQLMDPGNDEPNFDKKDSADEIDVDPVDELGIGDTESDDYYDRQDKEDEEDPYVAMQSLMNPYDISETF